MTNQTGRIAVIPARGGSKRIPRKNVKLFAGQPMISYAIRTALESRLFDHVVVSTDDDEIVEVAGRCGAEVPFIRPKELSDDDTATVPVIVHAIENCNGIYPCVPFLQVHDLTDSFQLFTSADAQFCFPVVEFPSPIQRALTINTHGMVASFLPENELSRTQDLTVTYHDAGQFYWGSSAAWKTNTHIHSNAVGYVIPSWRTIDIDTPDDWTRAEILAKSRDDLSI